MTGAGRAFSAGQDLKERQAPGVADLGTELRLRYNPIVLAMRRLEKPVIGAINGVAAGAGISVALACDMRIAADSASFIEVFGRVGLVPDTGSTWFLPRLVGYAKAAEMMFTTDPVDAATADADRPRQSRRSRRPAHGRNGRRRGETGAGRAARARRSPNALSIGRWSQDSKSSWSTRRSSSRSPVARAITSRASLRSSRSGPRSSPASDERSRFPEQRVELVFAAIEKLDESDLMAMAGAWTGGDAALREEAWAKVRASRAAVIRGASFWTPAATDSPSG